MIKLNSLNIIGDSLIYILRNNYRKSNKTNDVRSCDLQ